MASIRVTIEMPVAVFQEDKFFVSTCPLGVTSQGESKLEARNNLTEALQLFIETCIQQGILERVMKEKGFSIDGNYQDHDADSDYPDGHLSVPISLIAAGMDNGSQATHS